MIHGFSCIIRNDQISSSNSWPPHGLAAYVKTGIKVIEFQKYSSDKFEAMYMYLCHPDDMKPVQIIGVYASQTLQWDVLKEEINSSCIILIPLQQEQSLWEISIWNQLCPSLLTTTKISLITCFTSSTWNNLFMIIQWCTILH